MENTMENNEIKVTIGTEKERMDKVEKALNKLAIIHEKAMNNKKADICDTDWNEYDTMNGEDKNDLLTRIVIRRGYSAVQKIRQKSGEKADYIFVDNIDYIRHNFMHVVSDMYARVEDVYKMKYPHNVHRALRCAVANSIYHCKEDDHDTKTTALYKVNSDGEEYCIVDTENERARDYEVDTEERAIFNVTIDSMEPIDNIIARENMYGYENKEIGNHLFYKHTMVKKPMTGQGVGKRIRNMKRYF